MSKNVSLDGVLHEIDKRFIAIKDPTRHFKVFKGVFDQVHEMMKQVDPYYGRYSSKIQYAGSFYDGVKVGQLDEFDMDIVIRLPIDYDDIEIEVDVPGCVKLRINDAFDKLKKHPDWQSHHKVMNKWQDNRKYFLQSSFRSWMEGVMDKAMNALNGIVIIDGEYYELFWKKSGPAFTIMASSVNTAITVDVDMVPVIQFSLSRWPNRHRQVTIPGDSNKNAWFVVPKPNYYKKDIKVQNRCWRLAFHDQEGEIMKDYNNLKPTLRLLKKLRDSLEMNAIASYYIKTLFLRKLLDQHRGNIGNNKQRTVRCVRYWENRQSILFADMVRELYNSVVEKKILYFWRSKGSNLLRKMNDDQVDQYSVKLHQLLQHIDNGSTIDVARALLTHEEFEQLKNYVF